MKRILLAATATFCLMTAAYAAEMPFPSDEPVAVVDWPDGWKSQETDTGVDATSPDDSIYLAIDVSETKDAGTAVTDALKYFASKGVTVDPATEARTETKLNGFDYATITWGGKDADGPVTISLVVMVLGEQSLTLSYWGTQGAQDSQAADIQKIIASLKPAS
jgi:opacity protein-like surface antigen